VVLVVAVAEITAANQGRPVLRGDVIAEEAASTPAPVLRVVAAEAQGLLVLMALLTQEGWGAREF
jgi:hypothetical protein